MTSERKVVTVEGDDIRIIAYGLSIAFVMADPAIIVFAGQHLKHTGRASTSRLLSSAIIKLAAAPTESLEPSPDDEFSPDRIADSIERIRELALEFCIAHNPSSASIAFPERIK